MIGNEYVYNCVAASPMHKHITTICNHSPANITFAINTPIDGHTYSSIITLADNMVSYSAAMLCLRKCCRFCSSLLLGTRYAAIIDFENRQRLIDNHQLAALSIALSCRR